MNERLLGRLRKVMALTTSPSEGEAAAATAMLAKLLEEHNLSVADLEMRGAARPEVNEGAHDLGKAAFAWKLDLAEIMAEHYYCHALVNRRDKTVRFVGRPDNIESMQMLYAWVIDQVKRISRTAREDHLRETGEHIDPLRWQVNFGLGVVCRMGSRLAEIRQRQQSEAGTALVVSHRSEVSDYLERQYGFRVDGRRTKREEESEARWRAYREERERERQRLETLKAEDPDAYYRECPWDTPDARARRADMEDKARLAEERKRRRREREQARRGYTYRRGRTLNSDDLRKLAQADRANEAGRANAGKINLQPFVTGQTTNDRQIEQERKKLN